VLEILQNVLNFSTMPSNGLYLIRNHYPKISVGTNPSGFQHTTRTSFFEVDFEYSTQHLYRPETFIVTSSEALIFLTCFNIENISFHIYVVSFKRNLWITLGIFILAFSVTIHFYLKFGANTRKNTFSPYFLMLSTLVEHSYWIPEIIMKRHTFRIAVGIWLLLVATITTGYKGASISQLTSPLPRKSITNFDNLTTENEKLGIDGNLTYEQYVQKVKTEKCYLLSDGNKKEFRILGTIHSGEFEYDEYTDWSRRNSKTYFTEQLESYVKNKG